MRDMADLIGRIFISMIFFFEIYDSIFLNGTNKYSLTMIEPYLNPNVIQYIGLVFLVIGSLTVFFGYRSTFGAILLLIYWLPITIFSNHLWDWNIQNIEAWHEQGILFMQNMALIGALLHIMAHGSGKYSIKRLLATTKVKSW